MDTTLTIKTKKELRDEAKKTAAKLGLPLSTVVNALLRQFTRNREIVLSLDVPNAETRRALRQASSRKGLKRYKSFKDWEKAMRSL
jgi:addiction module RelB/DinJ family antitoxin